MYHDVGAAGPTPGAGAFFAVSRRALDRQLALIVEAGHEGCSLERALASPAARRVAITFDDGDIGQLDHALPALVARGMTATFFVTTGWVGRPRYVSYDGLREMKAAGMSVQSHTHSHPFLSELDPAAVREELARSKGELDQALGQETGTLALPNGDLPRRSARHLLAETGYAVVATSRWGANRDAGGESGPPRFVRRCTVRGDPGTEDFRRILRRDPWLYLARQVRESGLGALRSGLGPTRYSRWRRAVLDLVARGA